MNNNQMNFDPMTGQPINQNVNNITNTTQPNMQTAIPVQQPIVQNVEQQQVQQVINTQQQMQAIPTVEQNKQEFINNTQAINNTKKEEKKEEPNIVFIIILFAIIFAAIFFLFPFLLKVL